MTNLSKQESVFRTLNAIDCTAHTEKKNSLSYLSWAWAWGMAKEKYPESYYTIYENPDGWNYFSDGKTCWVKTGVTMVDGDYSLEHIEYLPIMNYKNASIPQKDVTSCDVNKAIQRSLTKAIARHGLGLYIYAGEDLPEAAIEEKKAVEAERAKLMEKVTSIIQQIDSEVKKSTSTMGKEDKIAFANNTIVPIIGQVNYKTCQDLEKLEMLLNKIKAA
jgi:hypothetical protein